MEKQRFESEFSDKLVKIENKERTCSVAQLLQQLMLRLSVEYIHLSSPLESNWKLYITKNPEPTKFERKWS